MRAVAYTYYGSPDVLQLRELAKPVPKDNEVLVRVYAATVTPVDCAFRKGEPRVARLFTGLTKPKNQILGSELAGEVEEVGTSVKRFEVGDQIFGAGSGAHAEYICLPETGPLVIKPTTMTYEETAAIPYGVLTALPFLRDHGNLQSGQKVLVNGASGSIGTFAVQLAKYFGADVTGVCSTANVDLVRSLRADTIVDYTKEDFTKTGQTYDIIFDVVGKLSFSHCKDSLTPSGRYLTTVATPTIIPQMLWTSRFGSKKAQFATTGLRLLSEQADDMRFIQELAKVRKIKSVIDKRYPLERTAEAHRYVERGHKRGNVIINVQPPQHS